jgi:hypothetical protein
VLAESWLCVADKSTGFDYEKATKEWVHARFKADNKYVIKRADGESVKWEVTEIGEKYPIAKCPEDFDSDNLICEDWVYFRFNKGSLKFLLAANYGYFAKVEDDPAMQPDSVMVAIGRCSAI